MIVPVAHYASFHLKVMDIVTQRSTRPSLSTMVVTAARPRALVISVA